MKIPQTRPDTVADVIAKRLLFADLEITRSKKKGGGHTCRQGCPFSMTLFVLSTIPLTNMIKADKRITGHITKHVHPVKVQSYADDTTIIINQHNEIKYIYEIFN